ncbi:hypothetical protein [Lentzea sp. NPDC059081]|uniref:hypothetical protein n=1 Tax=Lentzea sp. NPDC059081 TaxID=3346719 RepID=UPI003691C876
MSFPGDSTWVISSGDGGTFPLFVRDALGIDTPAAGAVPPLVPPVPPYTETLIQPGIVEDWDRWWRDSVMMGFGREPLGLPDELRAAYRRWLDAAGPESLARRDQLRVSFTSWVQEVVADLEREQGYRPLFRLEVFQVPVEGQFWQRLTKDRVLVSEELMLSRNVIAPLESVIRDLAR